MTITAWYMDDSEEDQRLPHRLSDDNVPLEVLDDLGILSWTGLTGPGNSSLTVWIRFSVNLVLHSDDPRLQEIREARGYTYSDICDVCPEKLPGYDQKILNFFKEHIHFDEEIRFCVEGSGYFDFRDENDRWIRVSVEAGDMVILPEGIYHRFTCDEKNYIKAMVRKV